MRYDDDISAKYARLFADQKAGRAVMRMIEAQTWEGLSLVGSILGLAVEENGMRLGVTVWEQRERKRIWVRSLAAPRRRSSRSRSPSARLTPTRKSVTPQTPTPTPTPTPTRESQPRSSSVRSRTFGVDDGTETKLPANPNRGRMILSREERISRDTISKSEKCDFAEMTQRFSGLKRRIKSIRRAEAGNVRRAGATAVPSAQPQKTVENFGSVCDRLHSATTRKVKNIEEPSVAPQFRARPVPAFLKRSEFPSQPSTPQEIPILPKSNPQHDRMGTPLQSTYTPVSDKETHFRGSVYDSMTYLSRDSPERNKSAEGDAKMKSVYSSDAYLNRISPKEQEYTLDYNVLMTTGVTDSAVSALVPSPRAGASSSIPAVASSTPYLNAGDGILSGGYSSSVPTSSELPPVVASRRTAENPIDNLCTSQLGSLTHRPSYGSRGNTPPGTAVPSLSAYEELTRSYNRMQELQRPATPTSSVVPHSIPLYDELPRPYCSRSSTPTTAVGNTVLQSHYNATVGDSTSPTGLLSELQPPTPMRAASPTIRESRSMSPKPPTKPLLENLTKDTNEIVYRAYSTARSGSAGSDNQTRGVMESGLASPESTSTNYYEIQALKMYYEADRAALVNTVAELEGQRACLLEEQEEQARALFSNSISVITSSEAAQRDVVVCAEASHRYLLFAIVPPPPAPQSSGSDLVSHVMANLFKYLSALVCMTIICFAVCCVLFSPYSVL